MRTFIVFLCLCLASPPARSNESASDVFQKALVSAPSVAGAAAVDQKTVDAEVERMRALYPGAEIRVIAASPETLQALQGSASSEARPSTTQVDPLSPAELGDESRGPEEGRHATTEKARREICLQGVKAQTQNSVVIAPTPDRLTQDWFQGSSHRVDDLGKQILIVVAMIGVIVVAFLVVYSLAYLADAIQCGFETLQFYNVGTAVSLISDESGFQRRRGRMVGIRGAASTRLPHTVMGIAVEAGHLDVDVDLFRAGDRRHVSAAYAMSGPRFLFPFGPGLKNAFSLELLAGTAFDRAVGLLSTLRFGVDLAVHGDWVWGVNAGAVLLDLRLNQGLFTEYEDLNWLFGTSLSYRF